MMGLSKVTRSKKLAGHSVRSTVSSDKVYRCATAPAAPGDVQCMVAGIDEWPDECDRTAGERVQASDVLTASAM